MVDDGDYPVWECDDAGYFWSEEEESPFCWEDEDGNRYDEQELLERGYHFFNGEPVDAQMWEKLLAAYKKELEHAPRYVNTSGIGPT